MHNLYYNLEMSRRSRRRSFSGIYATVLLHKIFFAPKQVKLIFTLLEVCEYFRMNFNNSVHLLTTSVAMATMKFTLNRQIKAPPGGAGWVCHQSMLEAHPAGALVYIYV